MYTKTQLSERVAAGLGHESYHNSVCGVFDVTLMRQKALDEDREVHDLALNHEIVSYMLENTAYEKERVDYFINRGLQEWEPCIVVVYPDEKTLIIDGTHRILAEASLHLDRKGIYREFIMPFWVFEEHEIIRPPTHFTRIPGMDWAHDNDPKNLPE